MSEPNLHDLAARLARGDEAAFAELYDACADRLYRYLTLRVGSRDRAADVLQSTFFRAVKNRRRFIKVENPTAYLFQIARNEAIRLTDKRRRMMLPLPTDELPITNSSATTTTTDDADAIVAALARLSPDDREIVELKICAGLTFREIAEATGKPQGTVATKYRRALESLRGWLTKQLR